MNDEKTNKKANKKAIKVITKTPHRTTPTRKPTTITLHPHACTHNLSLSTNFFQYSLLTVTPLFVARDQKGDTIHEFKV